MFYPFFLDGVALDDKYAQTTGMHPNAQGVARIVEGILPKVEELLARAKAKGLAPWRRHTGRAGLSPAS